MSTKMWKKDSNMGMSDSSCVFVFACKRKAGTGDFRFAGLFSRRFSRSL